MRFKYRNLVVMALIMTSATLRAEAPMTTVTKLEVAGEKDRAEVTIRGSFIVPAYSVKSVGDGKTVRIEVEGSALTKNGVEIRGSSALVDNVVASTVATGVRVEVKLARDAVYRARGEAGLIRVSFEASVKENKGQDTLSNTSATLSSPIVEHVGIERRDGRERVVIETNIPASFRAVPGNEGPARLVVLGARLRRNVGVPINGDIRSVVRSVNAFQDADRVIVEVARSQGSSATAIREGNRIVWLFSPEEQTEPEGKDTVTVAREESVEIDGEKVAAFLSGIPLQIGAANPDGTGGVYTGRRIDLDFKDADIQNILRLLSEVGNVNVITSDDVKGTVTIRMRNVPWDQALDVVLRAKGLGQVRTANLIRVAPMAVLEKEREMAIERKKQQVQLAPLETRLVPVSYADANELMARTKDLLSVRGTVSVDGRTNVLVVRDVSDNLDNVEELVRTLDSQTPQVLIEARIIEATSQWSRDLGIQWGGDAVFTSATGNPTGLAFPYDVAMAGGASGGDTPLGGMSPYAGRITDPNFVVDLPAPAGTGTGGALGLTFGSVNGNYNLNVRLAAAEATGVVRLISSPRILTLDNNAATISQGTSIPYSQVSSGRCKHLFHGSVAVAHGYTARNE